MLVVAPDGTIRSVTGPADALLGADADELAGTPLEKLIRNDELARRLERSEERFRLMAQYGQDILVVVDADGTIRWASDATQRQLGLDPDAMVGRSALDLVHPDDHERAVVDLGAVAEPAQRRDATIVRVRRGDGEYEEVEILAADMLGEPAVEGIVLQIRIVTERVESGRRLEEASREMARLTRVLGATSDLVAITSRVGKLLYVNDAFCEFFSVERDELDAFEFEVVTPEWAQRTYVHETIPALGREGLWQGEFAYYRAGEEVPMSALFIAHRDDQGQLEFVSSITRDISDRKALEERLAHQATHDDLTGLPNRALMQDHLWLALSRATRSGKTVGLLFIDLDGFKHVNDTYGHRAGDLLLVSVADRLRAVMRPSDTVARFGGDEFVVLCDDLQSEHDAIAVAERVGDALRHPFIVEGDSLTVTGSIGIALAEGGGDSEILLRDADVAMYRAKDRGRDRYEVA